MGKIKSDIYETIAKLKPIKDYSPALAKLILERIIDRMIKKKTKG